MSLFNQQEIPDSTMTKMVGKYSHEKNENLDEYFKAVGVPYIPRKMMCSTSPSLEIATSEDGEWTISTSTMLRTNVSKFKLGEDYEESMPGGIIKNNTVIEDDKIVTSSIGPNGEKMMRIYEFTDTHCILTMKHEKSGTEAKRYFKRN
ncbi:sodium/calcium exchanger regulatory protein 1 isoform X2 [Aethina tumida]|uniref:sodium/calcium exchanger regulatory protein 1 isoform X2 n=1 Tax=Aethina tumida TaxID=116153 RepID=UPI00096B1E98|nr:sodium/calcium exchanger regulatory protein 1 isoform X2 [Aethina tumida]